MSSEEMLAWLARNNAQVSFGLASVVLWKVGYPYVVRDSLEESIVAMQQQIAIEAEPVLLLTEGRES